MRKAFCKGLLAIAVFSFFVFSVFGQNVKTQGTNNIGSGSGAGGTVTNVSATLPATVTNPTTTPNITVPVMVGSGVSAAAGLVPKPSTSAGTTNFLREDGTFAVPPNSGGSVTSVSATPPASVTNPTTTPNITVPVMVGSGASHASGLVPDPGASAGTTHFLREDGTFAVPPSSGGSVTSVSATPPASVTNPTTTPNITVPVMVGSGASHASGLVPDPGASAGTTHFLREDGTFAVPAGAISGSGAANEITTWSGTSSVTGLNRFTWNGTTLSVCDGSGNGCDAKISRDLIVASEGDTCANNFGLHLETAGIGLCSTGNGIGFAVENNFTNAAFFMVKNPTTSGAPYSINNTGAAATSEALHFVGAVGINATSHNGFDVANLVGGAAQVGQNGTGGGFTAVGGVGAGTGNGGSIVLTPGAGGASGTVGNVQVGGHLASAGPTPGVAGCGTSPAISGHDNAGFVTLGSVSTGCTITFGNPYPARPACVVTSEAGLVFTYSVTGAAITVVNVGALSSTVLDYHCVFPL